MREIEGIPERDASQLRLANRRAFRFDFVKVLRISDTEPIREAFRTGNEIRIRRVRRRFGLA